MHEIRKNTEKEEVLLKLSFKFPTFWKVYMMVFALISLVTIIIPIVLLVVLIVLNKYAKSCTCEITNKRIKGTKGLLTKVSYSYRLDMIDKIETSKTFGVNVLVLHFTQGNSDVSNKLVRTATGVSNEGNIFRINWVMDIEQVYEKISEILSSVKNENDVAVDIEMKKIDAEEKKAEAFSQIAQNLTNAKPTVEKEESDYIAQIEKLHRLKEQGIITEEEFNEKKKQLL